MRAPFTALLTLFATAVHAEQYPFGSDAWDIEAEEAEIVDYLGERSLRIRGGYATLPGVDLTDGLIEFDIAVSAERGFSGAIFRVQDLANYEHFYIRPHMSGNPDANQYTPVFNGVSAWQLYHGEGFGSPVNYRVNDWMHVTIAYRGDRAEVFIDSDTPVLAVDALRRAIAGGSVGVGAGNFAPAYFANVEVSPLPANYRFAEFDGRTVRTTPGTVQTWQVSRAFPEKDLAARLANPGDWTGLAAEPKGITNLARAPGATLENDTVIARVVIDSRERQTKTVDFGYSDRVTVYLNGRPLYRGDNSYQTRDYRYLGTIGLFDTVFLPLEEGANELWFAVTEAFGGWGIQARFPDAEGIAIPVTRTSATPARRPGQD